MLTTAGPTFLAPLIKAREKSDGRVIEACSLCCPKTIPCTDKPSPNASAIAPTKASALDGLTFHLRFLRLVSILLLTSLISLPINSLEAPLGVPDYLMSRADRQNLYDYQK